MSRLALLLLLLLPAFAANVRLYLTDGTHHIVREYKVESDRVRYYSIERGDWEEIPLDLVDLKRTEKEISARADSRREEMKVLDAEEKAEREVRREISRVPMNPGVYLVAESELKPLAQAEAKVVTNKRRSVLKAISPIPMITGKATLEIEGKTAATAVAEPRPEFYFRLASEERFTLVKLAPGKESSRIVERWTIIPVSKEVVQEHDEVEIFRRQVADGLYKVWPVKPLEPGEYAWIEYTEGKTNTQVWDFSVKAAAR